MLKALVSAVLILGLASCTSLQVQGPSLQPLPYPTLQALQAAAQRDAWRFVCGNIRAGMVVEAYLVEPKGAAEGYSGFTGNGRFAIAKIVELEGVHKPVYVWLGFIRDKGVLEVASQAAYDPTVHGNDSCFWLYPASQIKPPPDLDQGSFGNPPICGAPQSALLLPGTRPGMCV